MSGATLTEKELDNILITYSQYGAERLGDYLRSIWKEAWDEAYGTGYRTGVAEGYNMARKQLL